MFKNIFIPVSNSNEYVKHVSFTSHNCNSGDMDLRTFPSERSITGVSSNTTSMPDVCDESTLSNSLHERKI